jgi:hypothetical protein
MLVQAIKSRAATLGSIAESQQALEESRKMEELFWSRDTAAYLIALMRADKKSRVGSQFHEQALHRRCFRDERCLLTQA